MKPRCRWLSLIVFAGVLAAASTAYMASNNVGGSSIGEGRGSVAVQSHGAGAPVLVTPNFSAP